MKRQRTPCRPRAWPGVRAGSGRSAQRRASVAANSGSTGRSARTTSRTRAVTSTSGSSHP